MLVIETPAARYEDAGLRPAHEEHLLERVSALENTLGRLTDKLGQVLDLLLRQAKNSYMDHALLETLIGMLCEAGAVDQESLSRLWRERCEMESREQQEASRLESLKMKILAGHTGAGGSEFGELIVAGLDSLWRGENDRALETLEYAAKLSPSNSPLYLLLAEKSFENGNSLSALQYFVCAGTESERDARLSLLLGLCYGAQGERARAEELLRDSIKFGGPSFAAHYSKGRMLAADGKWDDAIAELHLALETFPSAEAHYAVGSAYLHAGNIRTASLHFRSALKMDKEYAAAHYAQGLLLLRQDKVERATKAFRRAQALDASESLYKQALRRIARGQRVRLSPPVFDFGRTGRENLIFCPDERLNEAVRRSALEFGIEACGESQSEMSGDCLKR